LAKRVLVVDDAAFMRMMIKNILAKNGYEVVEAADGEAAVELYKQHKPDLVTMDITMPVLDGVEAVKAIRKVDPNANIIMCSSMGQQALVIEAIQAGARDFIVKPFKQERIMQAIEKVMAARAGAHVYINGKVQGVYFRAETRERALQLNVRGWVRNLPDGRVEGLFEGDRRDVEKLIDWCRQGPPRAVVYDVAVEWRDYRGEFSGFSITI